MCQSVQHIFRDAKQTKQLELSFSSELNEFLTTSATARAVRSQTRHGMRSPDTRLDLLRDDRTMPPRPSPDLGFRVAKSGGQIQLSEFISTAIFLLSNKLHDRMDGDGGLELLFSLLDRDAFLATTLLQSHMPSVRAAWESLFTRSIYRSRKDIFRILTDVGIRNHWLIPKETGLHLKGAVEMGCFDALSKIVVYYSETNHSHWWRDSFEAILVACKKGDVACAKLLLQHSDVNAGRVRSQKDRSMFQDLVANLNGSNDEHAIALELFLASGADVDKYSARKRFTRRWRRLTRRQAILDATRPTMLDEIFYVNRLLFDKARAYSKVPVSRVTRTGLLVALEDSLQTLREYLSTRQRGLLSLGSRHMQSLLELLLAEQFYISKVVDMNIVRGLFELGVDFETPSITLDVRDFWRMDEWDSECAYSIIDISRQTYEAGYFHFAWHQFPSLEEKTALLDMLLAQEGIIGEHILENVVAQHGTSALRCLIPPPTDFATKALRALIRAARLNKFEEVEALFRMGVDPDAFIVSDGLEYSIQAIASQAWFSESSLELPDGGCSIEMMQLLAKHGARFIVTPQDTTPFDFAYFLLRESNTFDLLAKMKFFLGALIDHKITGYLPSSLLEICLAPPPQRAVNDSKEKRLEVFEYLFRRGAEVVPGSPLAALVSMSGREDLIRDVLYSGSDLNAYWVDHDELHYTPLQIAALRGDENLVRLFLREGANVNSPPHGSHGRGVTALEAICHWSPATEEEHQRKMRICLFLINQGAYINPIHPGHWQRYTILGAAAINGDLELAALLIREGANLNATSKNGTALDLAAEAGRLDMVEFLLNANALSCVRGANGYEGAIFKAKKYGHSAVADLIREHAAKLEAGTVFNPELLKPQGDCHVPGFVSDDEPLNDESSSDDDGENITLGSEDETYGPADVGAGDIEEALDLRSEEAIPVGVELRNLDAKLVLSEEAWPSGATEWYGQSSHVLDSTESWTGLVSVSAVAGALESRPEV